MKTERSFIGDPDRDRYVFDFQICTTDRGWAQFDTRQDACYFGNWVNPFKLKIITYAEGDVTTETCESDDEFVSRVLWTFDWYWNYDGRKPGIDPGFNEKLKARFFELRIGALLH